jgi:transposase
LCTSFWDVGFLGLLVVRLWDVGFLGMRFPRCLEALDLGLIGPREELFVTRPSKFAPELKARAIDLYRSSEGRTIANVARELGIGTETFRKWVRQDEADRGERDDRLTSKDAEELKRLRKENAELKRTNEILRLASAFRPGGRPDPAQVVTFVQQHRHTFGVAPLLAAIGEPVSTFYHRTSREPSVRDVADAAVAERIEAIWERWRRTYGAPRIHAMLAREGIRWVANGWSG